MSFYLRILTTSHVKLRANLSAINIQWQCKVSHFLSEGKWCSFPFIHTRTPCLSAKWSLRSFWGSKDGCFIIFGCCSSDPYEGVSNLFYMQKQIVVPDGPRPSKTIFLNKFVHGFLTSVLSFTEDRSGMHSLCYLR